MTDTLAQCRAEIDAIDEALIDLLAKRFRTVDRVIACKRAANLPAVIPDRVEQVLARARQAAAAAGAPVESTEKLWRLLIAETIAYERQNQVK